MSPVADIDGMGLSQNTAADPEDTKPRNQSSPSEEVGDNQTTPEEIFDDQAPEVTPPQQVMMTEPVGMAAGLSPPTEPTTTMMAPITTGLATTQPQQSVQQTATTSALIVPSVITEKQHGVGSLDSE